MTKVTDPALISSAVATARRWAEESLQHPEPRAAKLLAGVLAHPDGLKFTLEFVDGVLRPEDPAVAAQNLARLSRQPAPFLPAPLRAGLGIGVKAAPRTLLPVVRRTFALLLGDLVIDIGKDPGPALARLRASGASLNVNLLGEAVLGDDHARERLERTIDLLARDDVDYVSIKVSSVTGPHSPWAHEATVEESMTRLRPLMTLAERTGKLVNLDMEEYRDLHLTLEVFERFALELPKLRLGLAVQAYLREVSLLLERVQEVARRRDDDGGAPLRVRLVKGANLAMERTQSEMRGWPNPIHPTKRHSDASYLACLDRLVRPESLRSLELGVASHNIYSLATAVELAKARGVQEGVQIEMLAGMAVPLQKVLLAETGSLRLYVPVVPRTEFDAAISYLVRRLEENAAPENFMSGAIGLGRDAAFLDREEQRFREAVELVDAPVPTAWRVQERTETPFFRNAVDTDPALLANQEWAEQIRASLPRPDLGAATVEQATVTTGEDLDDVLERATKAGRSWAATPAAERAAALSRLGEVLEQMRTDLVTVAADEVGKLFDQADVEVSEACDFAHYYAESALEVVAGATHVPPTVTLVTPPWNFPLAIPLGGVAAALAAGSAVILKPASPARRCSALLAEACWQAGLPRDLVQFVVPGNRDLGRQLVSDERVELVVLTGSAETAQLFRSWRPALPLLAETSGKNALVVTPTADLDLAAADLVQSAFGHAGQKCSAASLGILVGSVARSKRFLDQVLDATASLVVEWPTTPLAQMGPLTEAPGEKLLRGLTRLGPGERWLLQPERIDERLWRPGIRIGVQPGSEFHLTEYFGPVLGLMAARDLPEAIEWQNGTDYGLTAGLHSLDADEIQLWLDHVEAGNLYVNRGITGAIVRRQPFGGWKRSAVGTGSKAGGPNYVIGFGHWEPGTLPTRHVTEPRLARLISGAARILDAATLERLRAAVASDQQAWREEYGAIHDPSALDAEINAFRYRPARVTVRVESDDVAAVLREASAALVTGSRTVFSFRTTPDESVAALLEDLGLTVEVTPDEAFDQAVRGRVRYLGERDLLTAVEGSIDVSVHAGPSLPPGRLAQLPYVREQAVSITNHRFGHPTALTRNLRL
ncbi:MAG: bifunctional proline dehydrogenase/L-glutamate gamma-semialdehyde dehydrogenase [Arachnia propionica]|uniref:bifunctional proline dehydrogenase/L-glutamate gamma-semialdehyde dehydrogenase n=1 Tax=Arachnia propionica TaxID=1750 RepID=UPI0026FF488C|nr:bifunctional proline dehydrogenase/L-glutamate gamma-semialdehyde dehydrogenase [Arachnia propionica]